MNDIIYDEQSIRSPAYITCGSVKMASNVIREANEDRKTEPYRNREKPVKKDSQGLLNSAGITSPSLASLCHNLSA